MKRYLIIYIILFLLFSTFFVSAGFFEIGENIIKESFGISTLLKTPSEKLSLQKNFSKNEMNIPSEKKILEKNLVPTKPIKNAQKTAPKKIIAMPLHKKSKESKSNEKSNINFERIISVPKNDQKNQYIKNPLTKNFPKQVNDCSGTDCKISCERNVCTDVQISVATIKDVYAQNEKIELTNTPIIKLFSKAKKIPKDSKNTAKINKNENEIEEERKFKNLSEFDGYLIQFEKPPIIVKKIEFEKINNNKKRVLNHRRFRKKILKETEDYSSYLSKDDQKIEKRIIAKLDRNLEFGKEFKIAFNGVVLKDITPEEIEKIKKVEGVKAVYPNRVVRATLMDSIPLINADRVWKIPDYSHKGLNLTGWNIDIGIIDTGIDFTHPDLGGCFGPGCKVAGGYDIINNDSNPMDDMGHGTHVAATAAGNGVLKGVAPDATLYSLKVLNSMGYGTWEGVIEAIEMSSDLDGDGIPVEDEEDYLDIISLSLGGWGDPDDPASKAIDNVVNAGIVAVVAAGNHGPFINSIQSPGTSRKAITVGATCKPKDIGNNSYCEDGELATFSSRGPVKWHDENNTLKKIIKPDLSAPGVNICAAQLGETWQEHNCLDSEHISISGTSMATPHVAGAAALLLQKEPNLTPDQVKEILKTSSTELYYAETETGKGRLNILNAIMNMGRPSSKIVNREDFPIRGDLTMKLQKMEESQNWVDKQIVTQQGIVIPAKESIKLDIGKNYGWNFKNVRTEKIGKYRVYASFKFNDEKIVATWEFSVDYLLPDFSPST